MSKLIGAPTTVQRQAKRKLVGLSVFTGLGVNAPVVVDINIHQGYIDADGNADGPADNRGWQGSPADLIAQGILTPDEVSTLAGLIAKAGDNLGDVLFDEPQED